MSMVPRLLALVLTLLAAPAAADPIAALDEAENMRSVEMEEISRILAADNVDSNLLTSSEVLAAIRTIPRGSAPDDFWTAYQAHVRAWERAAAAEQKLEKADGVDPEAAQRAATELAEAEARIEATFAEVGRIAESYGVTLPELPLVSDDPDAT